MTKIRLFSAIGAIAACAMLAGCDHSWRPSFWNLRQDRDAEIIQADVLDEGADEVGEREKRSLIRGFYKNNRKNGGLSQEARDIEESFNIGN